MPNDPFLPVDQEARGTAKRLLRTARSGTLATLERESGFPFASLVGLATACNGTPVILTSQLSVHTRLMEQEPRCSLLLSDIRKGDPLAHPRLTLQALARRVERPSDMHDALRRRYLAHHPKAALYADFPDFSFWRLAVQGASLNGGFGRAYHMEAADILTDMTGLEDFERLEEEALAHMNADHADVVALYAERLCGARPGAWRMTSLDPEGAQLALGDEIVRLSFPQRLSRAADLRPMLVALAEQARGASAPE